MRRFAIQKCWKLNLNNQSAGNRVVSVKGILTVVFSKGSSSIVYFPSKYHIDSFHSTEKSINGKSINICMFVVKASHFNETKTLF